MLSTDRRWILIRNFSVAPSDRAAFNLLISNIEAEPTQAGLITQVEQLIDQLIQVETSVQKLGTKEAGVTKADVLEFNDRDRLYFTQARRDEILAQIACLIGWTWGYGILAF